MSGAAVIPPGSSKTPSADARRATLVDVPGSRPVYTGLRQCDSRTAVARGLAQYLASLQIGWRAGRPLRFQQAVEVWSSPASFSKYPSAAVMIPSDVEYDASSFVPKLDPALKTPDGQYVVKTSEAVCSVSLEIWATDEEERDGLSAMLEDALAPLDWMYGFLLDLPFYFGARAKYAPASVQYLDSDEDAVRRFRRAVHTLKARVPVLRLASYQPGRLRTRVDVDTSNT